MVNEQIRQMFPVGMILILILVGWGAVSLLFTMLKSSVAQLGPVLLTGAGAVVADLIIIAILAAIFYGILKRLKWARKLSIGYYIFSMIFVAVNLLSFMSNSAMYTSYYQQTLSPQLLQLMTPTLIMGSLISATVFAWVIGLIIIIYMLRRKAFFVN